MKMNRLIISRPDDKISPGNPHAASKRAVQALQVDSGSLISFTWYFLKESILLAPTYFTIINGNPCERITRKDKFCFC
jgi:hypothetical protein